MSKRSNIWKIKELL